MTEISRIRQDDSDLHKRWFTSETEDLYIWTKAGSLQSFEYCFDKHKSECSIRWHRDHAPAYTQIDGGDHDGGYKMSPVSIAGYKPDIRKLLAKFAHAACYLENKMYNSITDKIEAL